MLYHWEPDWNLLKKKIMKFQLVLMGNQYFSPLETRLKPIKEKNNGILIGFNGYFIIFPIKNPIETYSRIK